MAEVERPMLTHVGGVAVDQAQDTTVPNTDSMSVKELDKLINEGNLANAGNDMYKEKGKKYADPVDSEDEKPVPEPDVIPDPAPEEKEEPKGPTAEERLSALEKRLADKEAMLQRQANELGELRKAKAEQPAPAPLDDLDMDPLEAVEDKKKFASVIERVVEKKLMKAAQAAEELRLRHESAVNQFKQETLESYPDFTEYVEDMAKIAKISGDSDESVNALKANPFTFGKPAVMMLYNLAKASRALTATQPEAPAKQVKKVSAGALNGRVPGGSGNGTASAQLTEDDISNMPLDQLKKLIKEGNLVK